MRQSKYKSYDDLPLFLNAELVAQVLGVAPSSAYELMHETGFPVLKVATGWSYPRRSSCSGWRRTRKEVLLSEQIEAPTLA